MFAKLLLIRLSQTGAVMSSQDQTTPDQTIASTRDLRLATHNLWETATADPSLQDFLDLLKAAGLTELLCGPDLLTLLAPVNEAFQWERPVDLASRLILRGALTADELRSSKWVKTLEGRPLEIGTQGGSVTIGGAPLLRTDVECTNGVIHFLGSLPRIASAGAAEELDIPART